MSPSIRNGLREKLDEFGKSISKRAQKCTKLIAILFRSVQFFPLYPFRMYMLFFIPAVCACVLFDKNDMDISSVANKNKLNTISIKKRTRAIGTAREIEISIYLLSRKTNRTDWAAFYSRHAFCIQCMHGLFSPLLIYSFFLHKKRKSFFSAKYPINQLRNENKRPHVLLYIPHDFMPFKPIVFVFSLSHIVLCIGHWTSVNVDRIRISFIVHLKRVQLLKPSPTKFPKLVWTIRGYLFAFFVFLLFQKSSACRIIQCPRSFLSPMLLLLLSLGPVSQKSALIFAKMSKEKSNQYQFYYVKKPTTAPISNLASAQRNNKKKQHTHKQNKQTERA